MAGITFDDIFGGGEEEKSEGNAFEKKEEVVEVEAEVMNASATQEDDPFSTVEEKPKKPTKPESTEQEKPVQKAKLPAKPSASTAISTEKEKKEEIVFGSKRDEEEVTGPGIINIKFGTFVNSNPVEKYKGEVGKTDRIAIIDDDIKVVKTHFQEGIGYFYCFEGDCCDVYGMPAMHYIIPIIQYDTNKEGKPISKKFQMKYLSLSHKKYMFLKTILENATDDITVVDLIMVCKEAKFQDNMPGLAGKALWRTDEKLMNDIITEYSRVKKYLTKVVARKITREELMRKLGEKPSSMGGFDFSGIRNED